MQKILIADDNISLLEILKLSLHELGYEVKSAINKSDLMWVLKSFKPDMIILDVFMDKDDGREICKKLKEDFKLTGVPILLFSSNKYAISNYKKYGADDCMEKPFPLPDLIKKIKEILPEPEII